MNDGYRRNILYVLTQEEDADRATAEQKHERSDDINHVVSWQNNHKSSGAGACLVDLTLVYWRALKQGYLVIWEGVVLFRNLGHL